jgi:hypothetical protein
VECGFHVDGRAIFRGGIEFPLRDGFGGEAIEARIDAAQHANIADRAIGVNHGVEDHRTPDIFLHELLRIGGIDFARGLRLGEIDCRWFRIGFADFVMHWIARVFHIHFGEADDPRASGGVEIRHAQREGIKLAPAEDGAFGLGEFGCAFWLYGVRWSSRPMRWADVGRGI